MNHEAGPRLPDALTRFLHLGRTALPIRHETATPTENNRARRGNRAVALGLGFLAFNVGGAAGGIVLGGGLLLDATVGAAAAIYAYHRVRRN